MKKEEEEEKAGEKKMAARRLCEWKEKCAAKGKRVQRKFARNQNGSELGPNRTQIVTS